MEKDKGEGDRSEERKERGSGAAQIRAIVWIKSHDYAILRYPELCDIKAIVHFELHDYAMPHNPGAFLTYKMDQRPLWFFLFFFNLSLHVIILRM